VNLKTKAGKEVLGTLIERADVITTNWRPGAAARLGIDYETLRVRFPRLVYCNTRGYEKGPRSDLPGTDQNIAALTGSEWEDGACESGNPPMWSRSNMGDTGNALLAAIAISAALYHRDRTGVGQAVSTSIVNAGLLHTSYAWIHADGTPGDWKHVDGDQLGLGPFYRLYQCADGAWLFLAAILPDQRSALSGILGISVSADSNDDEKAGLFASAFRARNAGEWFALLDTADVPVELVDEEYCQRIFDDPEARSHQIISDTWSASVGKFEDPGLLVNVFPAVGVVQRGPCGCGQHTREILKEHGFADQEIDSMVEDRSILDAPVVVR
jgi:crotonobetainyl-CoA:carnitine CoA-transferase CaiB-like acyl-CoA transferase